MPEKQKEREPLDHPLLPYWVFYFNRVLNADGFIALG